MKKTARIAAVISIAALTLAGCGDRPSDEASDNESPSAAESTSAPAESVDFKACMVSDSGGFDDKSFNQTSYNGLLNAKTDLGVETGEVESNSDSEYADNIDALVAQGCNSITTVGFLLGDATEAAAKANPEIDFSIVDYAYEKPSDNLKGLVFDTAQPAYLAGYLAAAQSESGVVGTFGGLNIPTVSIFMEGFKQGVEKFNEDNDGAVEVVGWDGKDGTFVGGFDDKSKGQSIAEGMIQQGADVIMPVAGPAGLGGLQAVKDAGVKGIWVDTDGCESAAEYCDVLLTSVVKGMDVAVEESIKASVDGDFNSELFNGTLENEGVGLAPFHEAEGDISDDVKSQIEDLKAQIVDGSLKVG
ncbi:BMP family ABC transporter substrate-binding protein [Nocardioides sp. InS609-2]|uniref:BMP family lipoprotein n=1 Tax=Nocardioides sp. InS609-2 TaxID=2760705 RepID=UPI00182ADF0A|nr:BMP family ABC transporter substrate-binding protein [Nocardioides sp. InS609-2]MBA3782879.1 BMP family ABC transporter substrate-binding protein [Nocardioides sp.]